MEQPFPTAEQIRDKYEKGPGNQPETVDMTVPGQQPMTREQVDEFLDRELPLMRKQAEYDKLLLEQLENDALLNRRPIENIPGLLGLELKVRQVQAMGFLGSYKASLEKQEQEQKLKEQQAGKETEGA